MESRINKGNQRNGQTKVKQRNLTPFFVQFDTMPQVLGHAEFAALYLAYEQRNSLPRYLKMDTDRPLCTFSNGCMNNLHRVLAALGVEKLFIRDCTDHYYKLTPTTPATLQGTITLGEWANFNPQNH